MFDDIDRMSEEELEEEMQKILSELEPNPEEGEWELPEELHDKVMAEIRRREDEKARTQLSDEDRELLRYGRIYKRQMKHRKYWVLAAVLVMVLAVGMTSVGGPERFVQMMTRGLSGRAQTIVDSDDGDVSDTEGWTEEEAYTKIEEKFGFYPVKLNYLPDGVVFEEMELWEEIQEARLLYVKNDRIHIQFQIKADNRTGSQGFDIEDPIIESYAAEYFNTDFEITKYKVKESGEIRWRAAFVHDDVGYNLVVSDVDRLEFETILECLVLL